MAGWADDDVVVNLQGDEPLVPPALLSQLAHALFERPAAGIATVATLIHSNDELCSPHVVKVVFDEQHRALYFSRAAIPHDRDQRGDVARYRHLGLYAYRVRTLQTLAATPVHALERCEQLEQLRALAHGIAIHVELVTEAPPPGVDTEADLQRVDAHMRGLS
jgi:3-deoxy-manno-octulosonate cytidylyltransferase (CMP-KDO synthetase)